MSVLDAIFYLVLNTNWILLALSIYNCFRTLRECDGPLRAFDLLQPFSFFFKESLSDSGVVYRDRFLKYLISCAVGFLGLGLIALMRDYFG